MKVSDCKKVDLNAQKQPKFGKHNFLADTSEVPAGVCLIDILIYYINTNEIPSELSHENLISSHVKITCDLHM